MVDSTLCSDYVVFMHWCGEVDAQLQRRCVRHILKRQLPDGGWNIYYGGPSEINASVKAYFALKLAACSVDAHVYAGSACDHHAPGRDSADEHVQQALPRIARCVPMEIFAGDSAGDGASAELGSFSHLQNVVVEPAMLIPLSIINHFKPTRILPGEKQLHELYPLGTEQADLRLPRSENFWTWRNFFLRLDDTLKFLQPLRIGLLRQRALEAAERWMLERIREGSDGLAAVYPAMLNCMIALRALGYSKTNPVYAKAEKDFNGLFVNDPDDFRIQPCLSPVWDTAITIISLADSGLSPEHRALQKAAEWLVNKEVRIRGDWTINNSYPEASGWAFEYNNAYYADTDDTAMVLMALRLVSTERLAVTERFVSSRAWVAAQFPMSRRRLGGLRQERHDSVVGRYAVCGSQTLFSIPPAAT